MNPDVRALFPGASEQPYFDISANSLMAEPVRAAIERHLGARTSGRGDKTEMVATVDRARASFASLIGAAADEVAITKNVSDGLNLFGASLPWRAGDNVVLCPALEHPNNIYLWYSLVRTHGIEVRPVAPEDGHVPVEAMAAAMDDRTRLVTIPSITFAPGFVTDMKAIAAAARERRSADAGGRGAVGRRPPHGRGRSRRGRAGRRGAEGPPLGVRVRLPVCAARGGRDADAGTRGSLRDRTGRARDGVLGRGTPLPPGRAPLRRGQLQLSRGGGDGRGAGPAGRLGRGAHRGACARAGGRPGRTDSWTSACRSSAGGPDPTWRTSSRSARAAADATTRPTTPP